MNPYDFARIDWSQPPKRRPPIWHHQLTGQGAQRLYSGHLDVDVFAETPLFIADPSNPPRNSQELALSIRNHAGDYIIPGTSLKGMLRSVVETVGNGCLTLFHGLYEPHRITRQFTVDYQSKVRADFQHCHDNRDLCIACRIFGMLSEQASGVFLGKVNIGDAVAKTDTVKVSQIYIDGLMGPKPHHEAFYLDVSKAHIAGRKFYFHHLEPLPASGPLFRRRYIQPLGRDTQFRFRLDFTALEAEELGALLFAIALEKKMRHKIGYGKPLGLGSIYLEPVKLTQIDYAARYTSPGRGKIEVQGETLWNNEFIDAFEKDHLAALAWDDLRRIWRWEPDPTVKYRYPSKPKWFDIPGNSTKRIHQTP
jgi:hypothetical protein